MGEKITLERVFSHNNIDRAIKIVSRKDVMPGLDGMKTTELSAYWQAHRRAILTEIDTGSYIPTPLRLVFINKPGKKEKRRIAICSSLDQMLQHCIRFEIDRYFTPNFHYNSYGFIRGKGTRQALLQCLRYMNEGKVRVVDADIRKCFDSIKHHIVLRELESAMSDDRVTELVGKFLKNPGIFGEKLFYNRRGLPQGSCLSPVLANLVLNKLDWFLNEQRLSFVRYADDLMIFSKTEHEAYKAKGILERFLNEILHLQLNQEKTNVLSACQVSYLGYSFCWYNGRYVLKLSNEEKEQMRCKLGRHIEREGGDIVQLLDRIGAFNRGWLEYYGKVHPSIMTCFLQEIQQYESAQIADRINRISSKNEEKIRGVLNSKGYVTPMAWYDEIKERGAYYDEELW